MYMEKIGDISFSNQAGENYEQYYGKEKNNQ